MFLRLVLVAIVMLLLIAIVVYLARGGGRMPDQNQNHNDKTDEEKAVEEMQGFLQHLGAYIIVVGMLLVLNLVTDPENWWFLWVAFFWGIGLAFHAFNLFVGENTDLARRLVQRRTNVQTPVPSRSATDAAPDSRKSRTEIESIVREGTQLVDRMRADARLIPGADPRREALAACAASDLVLSAIEEHPDEVVLARDFLHQFLEPAGKLVRDYARLASRDVPSARQTVAEVESNDLPALTRRANAIYDRMHRGTLIDLEVAREMMALDVPIPAAGKGNGDEG
jgi:hypothetical protein